MQYSQIVELGHLVSLALFRQPAQEKENSKFKPVLFRLKLTLCHILAEVTGWGRYIPTYIYNFRFISLVP